MSKTPKIRCGFCEKEYDRCPYCPDEKLYGFAPWRSFVCSVEHFKVFCIAQDYANKKITLQEAGDMLSRRNIEGYETSHTDAARLVREIMGTVPGQCGSLYEP